MSFNYPFTCHIIDKEIENFKSELEGFIENLVQELNPLYYDQSELSKDFISNKAKDFYLDVENIFESIRSSNSDIRSAAEDQINSLERIMDSYE